jgi:hypothetical protein
MKSVCVALIAGLLWTSAQAEPVAAPASAFKQYRPFSDQAVSDWRAANQTVGEIGGWQTYARETFNAQRQKPAAPAEKPGASPEEKPADQPSGKPPATIHQHGKTP